MRKQPVPNADAPLRVNLEHLRMRRYRLGIGIGIIIEKIRILVSGKSALHEFHRDELKAILRGGRHDVDIGGIPQGIAPFAWNRETLLGVKGMAKRIYKTANRPLLRIILCASDRFD